MDKDKDQRGYDKEDYGVGEDNFSQSCLFAL